MTESGGGNTLLTPAISTLIGVCSAVFSLTVVVAVVICWLKCTADRRDVGQMETMAGNSTADGSVVVSADPSDKIPFQSLLQHGTMRVESMTPDCESQFKSTLDSQTLPFMSYQSC